MVEVFGASIPTPDWSFGFNSSVVWLLVVIFLIVILGVVAFFVMRHLLIYNKKIVVFENISGQGYQPVFKDRARLIKLGDGGEEIPTGTTSPIDPIQNMSGNSEKREERFSI